jgi:putative SOS response-associated peptidase YedK
LSKHFSTFFRRRRDLRRVADFVGEIHDRMPVILAPADYARWLGEEPDPRDLMRPSRTATDYRAPRHWGVTPSRHTENVATLPGHVPQP